MGHRIPLAQGQVARTACARALLRSGVEEATGEALSAAVVAERVGWCADLTLAMVGALLVEHWNPAAVGTLARGVDAGGYRLPSKAWMALRRLGWATAPPEGVRVNDRIVRMAQEQAGRVLRSAKRRVESSAGVLAAWPAAPARRTPAEWERVRGAIPGGGHLPSNTIRARTRQIASFEREHGRLPADAFEVEAAPRAARMLLLAACDAQQATIARHEGDPRRALLRVQLPTRPDPQTYRDWTWVACPITLPPTVGPDAVIHLPTLRPRGDTVRADVAYTHPVPAARRTGPMVALGGTGV